MSVFRRRREQELAQLRAGGWTVVTETPLDRLRAARRARTEPASRSSTARTPRAGWSR